MLKVIPEHFFSHSSKNKTKKKKNNMNTFHFSFTESRVRPKKFNIRFYFISFWPKKNWLSILPVCTTFFENLDGNGSCFTCVFNTFSNFSKMDKLSHITSYILNLTWEGTFWKFFRTVLLPILISPYFLSSLHRIRVFLSDFTDLHKAAVLFMDKKQQFWMLFMSSD